MMRPTTVDNVLAIVVGVPFVVTPCTVVATGESWRPESLLAAGVSLLCGAWLIVGGLKSLRRNALTVRVRSGLERVVRFTYRLHLSTIAAAVVAIAAGERWNMTLLLRVASVLVTWVNMALLTAEVIILLTYRARRSSLRTESAA